MARWLSVKITEAKIEYHYYRMNFWDAQCPCVSHLGQSATFVTTRQSNAQTMFREKHKV